jgi:hypothetical protein
MKTGCNALYKRRIGNELQMEERVREEERKAGREQIGRKRTLWQFQTLRSDLLF